METNSLTERRATGAPSWRRLYRALCAEPAYRTPGRLGPGNDVLGSRTSDTDYVALRKSLKKRVLAYFKEDFWADTAVFTGVPATKAGMEFFPRDKIVFASDCPFDPEGGTMYPRETMRILDELNLSKTDQEKIYFKNLEAVTGRKLTKS